MARSFEVISTHTHMISPNIQFLVRKAASHRNVPHSGPTSHGLTTMPRKLVRPGRKLVPSLFGAMMVLPGLTGAPPSGPPAIQPPHAHVNDNGDLVLDGVIITRPKAMIDRETGALYLADGTVYPVPRMTASLGIAPYALEAGEGGEAAFAVVLEPEINGEAQFRWQLSPTFSGAFKNVTEDAPFFGTNSDTLVISPLPTGLDGHYFRARVRLPGPIVHYSEAARLVVHPKGTFSHWATAAGIPDERRAPLHRHEPLGLTTLEAYAFGLVPADATPGDLPRLDPVKGDPTTLRFSFRFHVGTSDITVRWESSSDLDNWVEAEMDPVIVTEKDGVELREAILSTEPGGKLFLRSTIEMD